MMTTRFEEEMDRAVSEVFESMCFLSAKPALPRVVTAAAGSHAREVARCLSFSGPRNGRLGLRATLPSARLFASNLLGEEEGNVADAQTAESLGEIANMVCGAMLGHLEPEQAFTLTHPLPCSRPPEPPGACSLVERSYQLDDATLEAWIELESL